MKRDGNGEEEEGDPLVRVDKVDLDMKRRMIEEE